MKHTKTITYGLVALLLLLLAGCTTGHVTNEGGDKMDKVYAVIETPKGTITAELYTEEAPITTANFIALANSGFYNGIKFHRYEPGFVIQGGDPDGDGSGGSEKTIPLEISPKLKHIRGALGMARTSDPNSASSQFYITLDETPFLDGQYAVFGRVIDGMPVAENLRVGDVMTKVTIQEHR